MMSLGEAIVGLILCLLLQQADVPQLNYERTLELDSGTVRSIILDALSGEIKATIVVRSPGVPVHVYVVLEKDREAAEESVLRGKKPEKLLASKEKTEEVTLQATIPAKTEFVVLLACAGKQKAEVKLKVTAK